jgi:hypothetical protein
LWHLDAYPTRQAADAAKGPHSTVVQSLGKVWLMSIEKAGWRPPEGEQVAEIGRLPDKAGETYSAQYLEALLAPGMTAPAIRIAAPRLGTPRQGRPCLGMPEGKQIGRAGQYVTVPGGRPMHLTATGTAQRRALVLILHQSSQPATTLIKDWTPKGLCKN